MKKQIFLLLSLCLTVPAMHAMENAVGAEHTEPATTAVPQPENPTTPGTTDGRTVRILKGAASLARRVFVTAPHAAGSTLYSYANRGVSGTASALKVAGGFAWQHKGILSPVTWARKATGLVWGQNPTLRTRAENYVARDQDDAIDPERVDTTLSVIENYAKDEAALNRLGLRRICATALLSGLAAACTANYLECKPQDTAIAAGAAGAATALLSSLLHDRSEHAENLVSRSHILAAADRVTPADVNEAFQIWRSGKRSYEAFHAQEERTPETPRWYTRITQGAANTCRLFSPTYRAAEAMKTHTLRAITCDSRVKAVTPQAEA